MTEFQPHRHGLESALKVLPRDGGQSKLVVEVVSGQLYFNLRGNSANAEFVAAANTVLGQNLPIKANTFTRDHYRIFWLGPDEWLVVGKSECASDLPLQLRASLTGFSCSVAEVSGGQVCLRLTGVNARNVLAKGCTLDLHPDYFRQGDCAQSGLAKTNVLIALINDQPEFEIHVRRSFAEYLVLWLNQAGREFVTGFRPS